MRNTLSDAALKEAVGKTIDEVDMRAIEGLFCSRNSDFNIEIFFLQLFRKQNRFMMIFHRTTKMQRSRMTFINSVKVSFAVYILKYVRSTIVDKNTLLCTT